METDMDAALRDAAALEVTGVGDGLVDWGGSRFVSTQDDYIRTAVEV